MMVIVWGKALQRFISKVLPALGVKGVAVRTFAEWSDLLRARLYPFMPTRKADDTPGCRHAVEAASRDAADPRGLRQPQQGLGHREPRG